MRAWSSQSGAFESIQQGRLTVPARVTVEWVARRFGLDNRLTQRFVACLLEVCRFFADAQTRLVITQGLADTIEETRPQILMAHSLGSVVSYETLWAHPHPEIDLLVTLGSPLAMPDVIYQRLTAHPGRRARPPGVRRWINIADPGDIIAIPSGRMPTSFDNVTADINNAIHVFDFHRVTNYLACPATAGVLATFL